MMIWKIFQELKKEGKVFRMGDKGKLFVKWGHFWEFMKCQEMKVRSEKKPCFDLYRGEKNI